MVHVKWLIVNTNPLHIPLHNPSTQSPSTFSLGQYYRQTFLAPLLQMVSSKTTLLKFSTKNQYQEQLMYQNLQLWFDRRVIIRLNLLQIAVPSPPVVV